MSCHRVASEICGSREIGRKARRSRERGLRYSRKCTVGRDGDLGQVWQEQAQRVVFVFLSVCLSIFLLFFSLPLLLSFLLLFFFLSQGLTNPRPAFKSLSSCLNLLGTAVKKRLVPLYLGLLESQWLFLGQMEGRDREPPCKYKSRAPEDIVSVCLPHPTPDSTCPFPGVLFLCPTPLD